MTATSAQRLAARVELTSVRMADHVPGGAPNPAAVWFSVTTEDGRHGSAGFYATTASEFSDIVVALAAEVLPSASTTIASAKDEASRACERAKASHRLAEERRAVLAAALEGRALFGEALVVVGPDGVWLQDPVKRDAGFGMRFDTLGDLWTTFPQLRPVRWQDGNLIVSAWALPAGKVER